MLRVLLSLLPLLASCAAVNRLSPAPDCSAQPPSDAVAPTLARIDALAGTFALTMVTTSFPPSEGISVSRTDLQLHRPDSAALASARRNMIGRPRDLRLVGSYRWSDDGRRDHAEVDSTTLYLGCRDCLDGSPDVLRINALSANAFWGSWADYQTGNVYIVGKNGDRLPNPAGYFCAVRR